MRDPNSVSTDILLYGGICSFWNIPLSLDAGRLRLLSGKTYLFIFMKDVRLTGFPYFFCSGKAVVMILFREYSDMKLYFVLGEYDMKIVFPLRELKQRVLCVPVIGYL